MDFMVELSHGCKWVSGQFSFIASFFHVISAVTMDDGCAGKTTLALFMLCWSHSGLPDCLLSVLNVMLPKRTFIKHGWKLCVYFLVRICFRFKFTFIWFMSMHKNSRVHLNILRSKVNESMLSEKKKTLWKHQKEFWSSKLCYTC